jgi:ribonuclease HI
VAEYEGLLKGLEKSIELGATELTIKSDSQLLVRQLNGQYKVKAPHIIPLVQKAKKLLVQFKKVEITHIPREQNSMADALCNEALDRSP